MVRDSTGFRKGQEIYGQVGEIVAVERGIKKVVPSKGSTILIWWTHGSACEKAAPLKALNVNPGEEVFVGISPRPRKEWIDGVPTYDAEYVLELRHRIYAPSLEVRGYGSAGAEWSFMSAREYGEFYQLLPGTKKIPGREASWPLVRRWALQHPDVSQKQPACEWINFFDPTMCRSRWPERNR